MNPLRKLGYEDRRDLWGLLLLFVTSRDHSFDYLETLEQAAQTASSAAELATKMEAIFRASHIKTLEGFFRPYRVLPIMLRLYAKKTGSLLDALGKRGHKKHTAVSRFLVEASEFVKMKTNRWNDEHLVELLQVVPGFSSGLGQQSTKEFDGSFIRKRRERFKNDYPEMHRAILTRLQERKESGGYEWG